MTDKDKIRAEVYRRFIEAGKHIGVIAETREDELSSLLSFIDSLPVEPKFKVGDVVRSTNDTILTIIGMGQYCYHCENDYSFGFNIQDEFELIENPVNEDQDNEGLKEELRTFLDKTGAPFYWAGDEEQLEWLEIIARHFANWQKRQIMKDAINGEVFDSYDKDICQHHLELLVDIPKQYKDGDKVKLIIIKED